MTDVDPKPELETGQFILNGKYRVLEFLGQGAFAQVYRVRHLELKVDRAVKVVSRDTPGVGSTVLDDFRARFRLEAQLGARLDHPNVIRIHDFEEAEGRLYLVMEYAPGGSLPGQLREQGPLPVADAVRLTLEAAAGLEALHGLGAVHRDVKPSNILLDGQGHAKLADLGLAQLPGGPSRRSMAGSLAPGHPGTPEYMSPEQESTSGYLTPSSDVYSLGSVLFELLTGRLWKEAMTNVEDVRELRAEVPASVAAVLTRMLREEPGRRKGDADAAAKRYLTMGPVRQALQEASQSFQALPQVPPPRPKPLAPEPSTAPVPHPAGIPAPDTQHAVRRPASRQRQLPKWGWASLGLIVVGAIAGLLLGKPLPVTAPGSSPTVATVLPTPHLTASALELGAAASQATATAVAHAVATQLAAATIQAEQNATATAETAQRSTATHLAEVAATAQAEATSLAQGMAAARTATAAAGQSTAEAQGQARATATESGRVMEAAAAPYNKIQFAKKTPVKIGYSVYDMQHPYWQQYAKGIQDAATKAGYQFALSDQKSSQQTEVSGSIDLINQGISALVVSPVQPSALPAVIDAAHAAKIPVIIGDVGVAGEYDAFIWSDMQGGGKQAADYMYNKLKDKPGTKEVLVIALFPGSVGGYLRVTEFVDEIQTHSDFKVVATLNGNNTFESGYQVTQNVLSSNPYLAGIYAANDPEAEGAVQALKAFGKNGVKDVLVVGFNGDPPAMQLIKSGDLAATIRQDAYGQGQKAVDIATALMNNQTVQFSDAPSRSVFFPVRVVDSSNIDQFLVP